MLYNQRNCEGLEHQGACSSVQSRDKFLMGEKNRVGHVGVDQDSLTTTEEVIIGFTVK